MICDVSQVLKAQDDLVQRQLPFAVTRALTLTAQDARDEIRKGLPGSFTIRNSWTQRGVQYSPANKYKIPWTSTVFIGQAWAYLFIQETGGIKSPLNGMHIAIPEDVRSSPMQILRRSMRPKALLARKDVFLKDAGNGMQFIMQRLPDHKLKMLYLLAPSGHIKPRLRLSETALAIGQKNWAVNFAAAMYIALDTAR